MVVGARRTGLSVSRTATLLGVFHAQQFPVCIKNGPPPKGHPPNLTQMCTPQTKMTVAVANGSKSVCCIMALNSRELINVIVRHTSFPNSEHNVPNMSTNSHQGRCLCCCFLTAKMIMLLMMMLISPMMVNSWSLEEEL